MSNIPVPFYCICFKFTIFVHQPKADRDYIAIRLMLADDIYRISYFTHKNNLNNKNCCLGIKIIHLYEDGFKVVFRVGKEGDFCAKYYIVQEGKYMSRHVLVDIGKQWYEQKMDSKPIFMEDIEENAFLCDLENNPHAFVLACLMDRQVKAEKGWHIPYQIKSVIGTFDMETLASISLEEYRKIFIDYKLHRFNDDMSEVFYLGVQRIKNIIIFLQYGRIDQAAQELYMIFCSLKAVV